MDLQKSILWRNSEEGCGGIKEIGFVACGEIFMRENNNHIFIIYFREWQLKEWQLKEWRAISPPPKPLPKGARGPILIVRIVLSIIAAQRRQW